MQGCIFFKFQKEKNPGECFQGIIHVLVCGRKGETRGEKKKQERIGWKGKRGRKGKRSKRKKSYEGRGGRWEGVREEKRAKRKKKTMSKILKRGGGGEFFKTFEEYTPLFCWGTEAALT